MTGNNYLLDTSIVISLFKGQENIVEKVSKLPKIFISSIALGELYIGIFNVSNKDKHLKKLKGFLNGCTILSVDSKTAEIYGELVSKLHAKGKPIPVNDIWIAASALQNGLNVATRDYHFNQIDDLSVEIW